MIYRNPDLLRVVRLLPCQSCGIEDGTVVAAHSNQLRHGKGRGLKAHDWRIAALCYRCHMDLDQGSGSREEKKRTWQDAHEQTLHELFLRGLIDVTKNR